MPPRRIAISVTINGMLLGKMTAIRSPGLDPALAKARARLAAWVSISANVRLARSSMSATLLGDRRKGQSNSIWMEIPGGVFMTSIRPALALVLIPASARSRRWHPPRVQFHLDYVRVQPLLLRPAGLALRR